MEDKKTSSSREEEFFELIDIRAIPDDELDDLLGGAGSMLPQVKVG